MRLSVGISGLKAGEDVKAYAVRFFSSFLLAT